MYKDELKELLISNKNILSVWIDDNKDWHTAETLGTKEVTRETILKTKEKNESK